MLNVLSLPTYLSLSLSLGSTWNSGAAAAVKLISFGGLGVWTILDVILIWTGYVGPADGSAYVWLKMLVKQDVNGYTFC